MITGLINQFKKNAQEYGLVKRRPKKAQLHDQPADPDHRSISSSLPRIIQEVNKPRQTAVRTIPKSQTDLALFAPSRKGDLLACRFELKYRISESKAQAIRAYIRHHLPMDHHAMTHPGGEYPISSLYYDSANLDLCKETLVGKACRFKLRIRAYDDDPLSPLFFEIKRRVNRVILKSRARICRADLPAVLNGTFESGGLSLKDREALEQFLYYLQMIQGRPVVLVRYMREPYEGDGENRVRVTFDRNLCYRTATEPEVTLNGHGWRQIDLPFVVLEIKFTDHYPAWLREMVCAFNLNLSSMSKYVTSVSHTHRSAFSYYLE